MAWGKKHKGLPEYYQMFIYNLSEKHVAINYIRPVSLNVSLCVDCNAPFVRLLKDEFSRLLILYDNVRMIINLILITEKIFYVKRTEKYYPISLFHVSKYNYIMTNDVLQDRSIYMYIHYCITQSMLPL